MKTLAEDNAEEIETLKLKVEKLENQIKNIIKFIGF